MFSLRLSFNLSKYRYLYINNVNNRHASNYNATTNRQSKILNKLLYGKKPNKRKRYIDNDDQPKLTSASALSNPNRQSKNVSRRITVLNMLFMQNITDLLVNGSRSSEVAGLGVEISTVKISPDFHYLNCYWIAKGSGKDEEIARILNEIAGWLRHELSQLRLMGEVPKIYFIKDSYLSKLTEVDALLARADFGDDYVPSLDRLPSHNYIDHTEFVIPPMTHHVFGLKHNEILSRIKQNMNKSRQAWEKYEAHIRPNCINGEQSNISSNDNDRINLIAKQAEEKIYTRFLEEKQYSKGTGNVEKLKKSNYDAIKYYADEYENNVEQQDTDNWNDEKDFIEEEKFNDQ